MSAIQVAIRIKPLSKGGESVPSNQPVSMIPPPKTMIRSPFALDEDAGAVVPATPVNPWKVDNETTVLYDGSTSLPDGVRPSGPISYSFDSVYDTDVSTDRIYREAASELIEAATLEGFNATIFAYGQTSSGKTFTMHGGSSPGIIPLAMNHIFQLIQESQDKEFLLRVSYLEIYNEVIADLLNPENTNLKIHETAERGVFVGNATEEFVTCWEEVQKVMKLGEERRRIGKTNMNEHSSRSHTIFRMVIESRDKSSSSSTQSNTRSSLTGAVRVSCLNLVDLAGSERVGSTGAEGMRLKEGAHINKSLLALGSVISKLADLSSSGTLSSLSHVPFRDSKLTRILQPALGGNSRTLIICTMNPDAKFFEESVSTLKFASRARLVQNKPIVNKIESSEAILSRYRKEITDLKQELELIKKEKFEEERREELKLKLQLFEKMILKSGTHSATAHHDENDLQSVNQSFTPKKKRRQTWYAPCEDDVEDSPLEARKDANHAKAVHAKNDIDHAKMEWNHAREIDGIKKLLEAKQKECDTLVSTLDDLRVRNRLLEDMVQQKEQEQNNMTLNEKSTKKQFCEMQEAHTSLKEEFDVLEQSHLSLLIKHEELEKLCNQRNMEIKNLSSDKELLLERLSDILSKLDEINVIMETKDQKIEDLQSSLLMKDRSFRELQQTRLESGMSVSELEGELAVLKLKLIELTESNADKENELENKALQLNEKNLLAEQLSDALNACKEKLESVQQQYATQVKENETLAGLLDERQAALSSAEAEHSELKSQFEKQNIELNGIRSALQTASGTSSHRQKQLESLLHYTRLLEKGNL